MPPRPYIADEPSLLLLAPLADPKPLRVPHRLLSSERGSQIAFVVDKLVAMEPLRNFFFQLYTHTRPQYIEDFYTQTKELLVGEINASDFFKFVQISTTFSRIDLEELTPGLQGWIDQIHRIVDKIQKLVSEEKSQTRNMANALTSQGIFAPAHACPATQSNASNGVDHASSFTSRMG